MQIFRCLKYFDFIEHTNPSHSSPEFKWFEARFLVQFSLWCSSNSTSNFKSSIVLKTFNFVAEALIVGLIINYITIMKMSFIEWVIYTSNRVFWKYISYFSYRFNTLLAFDFFPCWRKFSFSSRYIPRCL